MASVSTWLRQLHDYVMMMVHSVFRRIDHEGQLLHDVVLLPFAAVSRCAESSEPETVIGV